MRIAPRATAMVSLVALMGISGLNPTLDFNGTKHKLLIGPSEAALVTVLLLSILLTACSLSGRAPQGGSPRGRQRTYTTRFPLTEDPLSEGGNWINAGTVGLDWANVRTTPGLVFGTESGSVSYDDSTAVLAGNWDPNQMAQAVVHTIRQNKSCSEEVELRLRTTIAAHCITGYEIDFRCTSDGSQYVEIVRWNGPLGDFTYVNRAVGPGLRDGDTVKATIVGSTITAYINGKAAVQGTDSTYRSGSPGIGFYLQGATGVNGDYGFTTFAAMDCLTAS